MRNSLLTTCLLAGLGAACAAAPAAATEGGGLAIYPDGLENYMSSALPAPGLHALVYAGSLDYDTLRGDHGESLQPDFDVSARVVAPRVIWVTSQKVFGGQLAFHAIVPLLDMDFRVGGARYTSTGVGDITTGIALGYHHSEALHYVVGLDVFAPTGDYDAADPSSPGKNYWTFQPVWGVTYTQPRGLNADLKVMYDFNQRNDTTDTRSGQALHADYDAGWGVGNGWVLGVGGYVFQQTSDDHGPNSAAGRARAIAFGPSLRYATAQGWLLTLKWQNNVAVRNRPEGNQLVAKVILPF